MDNETIAINLVTGCLVKNELPTADHVEQIVKQLTNFYKQPWKNLEATMPSDKLTALNGKAVDRKLGRYRR